MARATEDRTFVTRAQAQAKASLVTSAGTDLPQMIWVHLWPTAPGLETVPCHDERRWRWFLGTPLSLIMRRLLNRLQMAPQLVEVRAHCDETDVLAEHELAPDAGFVPFATFCAGAAFEAVAEAHQDLIEHGWRPRPLQPATERPVP